MLINGLIFGLISTLHCAGMCGPLAMTIPGKVKQNRLVFAILYQFGRIFTYILIASLVFVVGISFNIFRMQQFLSISIGFLMIVFVIASQYSNLAPSAISIRYRKFLNVLSIKLSSGSKTPAIYMGVLNGLLPCGAIYLAALYCASFQSFNEVLIYMGLFGLGTMPVFLAAWLLVSRKLDIRLKKLSLVYKFLPLLVGTLMILRGADLGIPYLSPSLSQNLNKTEVKNCCKH